MKQFKLSNSKPISEPMSMHEALYQNRRKGLKVDKFDLDNEVAKQPTLFNRVADSYAEAISFRDEAKEAIDTEDAKAELEIRTRLEDDGEKTTEAKVKALVQLSKRHQDAFAHFVLMVKQALQWEGLKEAFRQRSSGLRDLVNLHATSYFQSSSISGGVRGMSEDQLAEHRAAIRRAKERGN